MTLQLEKLDKSHLLFEDQNKPNSKTNFPFLHGYHETTFWSDRIVLIKNRGDNKYWRFTALDLLMNKTRFSFHPLSNDFGLIHEWLRITNNNEIPCVSLVRLDWETSEFCFVEHLPQHHHLWILVDKHDPSKFVLQSTETFQTWYYQAFQLVNGRIKLDEEVHQSNVAYTNYSQDKLMKFDTSERGVVPPKIKILNLFNGKAETLQVAESLECTYWCLPFRWANDHLFVNVYFEKTESYGLAWTDLKTKKWTLMNFESNVKIWKIDFFNGNLVIWAKDKNENNEEKSTEVKFHSVPIRRPNYLRKMAWLRVVQIMKQKGMEDPYESAKEFLPLNSDLREPWFKDEEKKVEAMEIP